MDILADLAFIGIVVLYVLSGLRRGFIRSLFDLVGGIAAFLLAVSYWKKLEDWCVSVFGKGMISSLEGTSWGKILFILTLFILFEAAIQALAALLNRFFHLPGLRQINSLLGGLLGFCKGVFVVLLFCAVLRIAFSVKTPSASHEAWTKISNSRVYTAVYDHNPVYGVFQSKLWSEVGRYGIKK